MRLLKSIFDWLPTFSFLIALLAILATAYLGDRADSARYRNECKRLFEPRGYICAVGE